MTVRALLVEDDDGIATPLSAALRGDGHEVAGREVVALAGRFHLYEGHPAALAGTSPLEAGPVPGRRTPRLSRATRCLAGDCALPGRRGGVDQAEGERGVGDVGVPGVAVEIALGDHVAVGAVGDDLDVIGELLACDP